MTSNEFVTWLRGFIEGLESTVEISSATATIKEKLKEVSSSQIIPNVLPMFPKPTEPNPYELPSPYWLRDHGEWITKDLQQFGDYPHAKDGYTVCADGRCAGQSTK